MAIGLAVLTAYGSTTIDRLYDRGLRDARRATSQFIPDELRDRPLRDALVVEALETWASREAASIMVGLFVVAARRDGRRRSRRRSPSVARPRMLAGERRRATRPTPRMLADRWQPRTRRHPLSDATGRAGEPVARRHRRAVPTGPRHRPDRRGPSTARAEELDGATALDGAAGAPAREPGRARLGRPASIRRAEQVEQVGARARRSIR